ESLGDGASWVEGGAGQGQGPGARVEARLPQVGQAHIGGQADLGVLVHSDDRASCPVCGLRTDWRVLEGHGRCGVETEAGDRGEIGVRCGFAVGDVIDGHDLVEEVEHPRPSAPRPLLATATGIVPDIAATSSCAPGIGAVSPASARLYAESICSVLGGDDVAAAPRPSWISASFTTASAAVSPRSCWAGTSTAPMRRRQSAMRSIHGCSESTRMPSQSKTAPEMRLSLMPDP